jgi:hypothetical protein
MLRTVVAQPAAARVPSRGDQLGTPILQEPQELRRICTPGATWLTVA